MSTISYLKQLFIAIAIIVALSIAYISYFVRHYPVPITDHISLDAKIKFIRENIDPDKVDTLILGSSIGLNDIQGTYLEQYSKKAKYVVNLSVYGATTLEVEQLFELRKAFPNLERIIYSVQYSDLPHEWMFQSYKPKLLISYMRHELSFVSYIRLLFHACNNIFFCITRQNEWQEKHMQSNKFEYLGFDRTGSVPLHIYGKDIISHRWRLPQPGIMSPKSFAAIERMTLKSKQENIVFYVAHQPYRKPLYVQYESVRNAMHYFDTNIEKIFDKTNSGFLIKLQTLGLDDRFFSDRTHLNDKGSVKTAKYIACYIDKTEDNVRNTK